MGAVLQETLRTEFSDRTLLAVAHRLHTIIEADRWAGCGWWWSEAAAVAGPCPAQPPAVPPRWPVNGMEALLASAANIRVSATRNRALQRLHAALHVPSGLRLLSEKLHSLNHSSIPCSPSLRRVLVMDKGRALEYGRPAELLEDDNGAFTGTHCCASRHHSLFCVDRLLVGGFFAASGFVLQGCTVGLLAATLQ